MIYFVNFRFLEATVFQDSCDWFQSLSEEVVVQFFKSSTGQGLGEVHAISEGFDFDLDLMGGRKRALCFFDFTVGAWQEHIGSSECQSWAFA